MELLIDSHHGIYIPKIFVEDFAQKWEGISHDDLECCLDPDSEWYWESWQNICDNATIVVDGQEFRLWQDGDLWALGDSDIVDDMGDVYDAKENPYAAPETIEWNVDNVEGFEDSMLQGELASLIDGLMDNIGDILEYKNCREAKETIWALKNYEDLEFCLEHNPGYYCDNSKLGSWQQFSPSYIQKESGEEHVFDGIFVGTIGNLGEIEIQADNGEFYYHPGFSSDYFRIIARVKS